MKSSVVASACPKQNAFTPVRAFLATGRRIAACSTVCGLVWSARARRVLRAKKKRQETPYDPIVEYRRVQEDPIGLGLVVS